MRNPLYGMFIRPPKLGHHKIIMKWNLLSKQSSHLEVADNCV